MSRQQKIAVTLVLVAVIAVASWVIYQNWGFNLSDSTIQTGSWQRPIQNFATTLTCADGKVFTTDGQYNVNCYDAKTGRSIWNGTGLGLLVSRNLAVADGVVCSGMKSGTVGCADEATGQLKWHQYSTKSRFGVPDVFINSGVVFGFSESGGFVTAFNASTGELIWEAERYDGPPYGNITGINSWSVDGFPLVGNTYDGGVAYCLGGGKPDRDGYYFKLDTQGGSVLWKTGKSPFVTFPGIAAITQSQVVIANGTQLFSLDKDSGKTVWSFNVGASINSPTIYGDILLFGAGNGNLYTLNSSSGDLLWKSKVDSQNLMSSVNNDRNTLSAYPILVEGSRLYWSFGVTHQLGADIIDKHDTFDGTVCCLDIGNGDALWNRIYQDNGTLYNPQVGMVINKDKIYLTDNTSLWTFNAANGDVTDFQNYDHYVLPPVKLGDQVFVAANLQLTAYQ
jgi:outer membrane protein assembly factor BamB